MKSFYSSGLLLLSFLCLNSCTKEEEKLNNPELLFSDSSPITIAPYSYKFEDINYHSAGDSVALTGIPDTLNNFPVLCWIKNDYGSITSLIISDSPIMTNESEILNSNDIIWQWHSGIISDSDTCIKYSEGRNVINGVIDYNHEPLPLNPGDYYWAIWKWNSEGNKIVSSSRQIHFYVKE